MTRDLQFKQLRFWSRNTTLSTCPPAAAWWRASRFLQSGMWISACNSPKLAVLGRHVYYLAWRDEFLVARYCRCRGYALPFSRETLQHFARFFYKLTGKPFVHGSLLNKHPLHWTKKLITSTILLKEAHKPGGVLLGILSGGLPPGSSNPDAISDQKNVIFHTRFQTWPLGRIYVIIIRLESKQESY